MSLCHAVSRCQAFLGEQRVCRHKAIDHLAERTKMNRKTAAFIHRQLDLGAFGPDRSARVDLLLELARMAVLLLLLASNFETLKLSGS